MKRYAVRRRRGDAQRTHMVLCQKHLDRRRELGQTAVSEGEAHPAAECRDCETAKEPTVLSRVIAAEDAANRAVAQSPIPVLRGQRRLFK